MARRAEAPQGVPRGRDLRRHRPFRDSALTVRQIGRRLGVGSVVEGSVRWSGESMRIRVALTDVNTGFDLWSSSFNEERADLFAIQDAIAREIVRQLTGRLLPADSAALDVARTRSRQAYDSYLLGIDRLRLRAPSALREAREHFERAISIDPNYAKPYAGLAEAYYHLSTHDAAAPREEYANRAKEYGRRALALDPLSSDAHAVLGAVAFQVDLQFEAAERELREAIRLNSSSAMAHMWLGETLMLRGRFEEAGAAFQRAAELDPLAPMPELMEGFREVLAEDPAAGLARWRALGDRFPEFFWGPIDTGLTLLAMGERAPALEAWREGARLYHLDNPDAAAQLTSGMEWLVRADRDPGQRAAAVRYWDALPSDVTLDHWRLLAFMRLDTDRALEVMRRMRERHDPLFVYSGLDLVWADPDQDIARLADFLEASGIPRLPMEVYTRLQPDPATRAGTSRGDSG